MIYVYGALIAVQIVLGQVLWKMGAEKAHLNLTKDFILSQELIKFLLTPYILLGIFSYASATLIFMAMLAKHEYTHLQAIVVSSSLLFTFIAAVALFNEKVTIINLLGLCCLVAGVIFITRF